MIARMIVKTGGSRDSQVFIFNTFMSASMKMVLAQVDLQRAYRKGSIKSSILIKIRFSLSNAL